MSSSVNNHDDCSNDASQSSPRISNAVPFVNGLFLGSPPSISMTTSTCQTTQDLGQLPESNWAGLGSNNTTTFHGTSTVFSGSALFSSDLMAFNPNFANHPTGLRDDHDGQLPVAHSDLHFTAHSAMMSHLSPQSPNLGHANQVVHSFNLSLGSSLPPSVASFGSAATPAPFSASTVPASQPVSMYPPQFPPCSLYPVSSPFDGASANVTSFLTPAPSTLGSRQCQAVAPTVQSDRNAQDGRVDSVLGSILPGTGGESVPSCMSLSPLDDILMSASGSQSPLLALTPGAMAELVAPGKHEPSRRRRRSSADIDPALAEALSATPSSAIKRVRINSNDSSPRHSPLNSPNRPETMAPPAPSSSSTVIALSTELLPGVTAHACGSTPFAQSASSPIPTCPSTIALSSSPFPISAIAGVPFSPPITPGANPQNASSVCGPGRESTIAPVGGLDSDTLLGETCVAIDGEGGGNALETELKKPRFEGDLYTPRIVRGSGRQREAKCHACNTDKWLNLKTSAYWYHMQYYHGISSASGHPFFEPIAHRWIISLAPSAAASATASDGSTATRLSPKTRKSSSSNKVETSPPMPPANSTPQGLAVQMSTHSPIIAPSDPLFPLLGPLPNPHYTRITLHQTRVRISVAIQESALCPHCNGWITLSSVRRPSRYDLLTHILAAAGMSNVSSMDIRDGLLPSEIAAARNVSVVLSVPPLGFAPTNCRGTGASSTWFRHAGRCIANEVK